jgi:hypothetical protein
MLMIDNIEPQRKESSLKINKKSTIKSPKAKRKSPKQIQDSKKSPKRNADDVDYFTTPEGKRRKKTYMLPGLDLDNHDN